MQNKKSVFPSEQANKFSLARIHQERKSKEKNILASSKAVRSNHDDHDGTGDNTLQHPEHPTNGLDSTEEPIHPARVVLHLYRADETHTAHQQGAASGFAEKLCQVCKGVSTFVPVRL